MADTAVIRLMPHLEFRSKRRVSMFEHHQEEMEKLMKENEEFLRIYNRHQELDKRVAAAETGTAPMEDLALNQLKKEKLWAKDRLARIMNESRV
jgi:uncharacterized protein YdcH (DUF465 family)